MTERRVWDPSPGSFGSLTAGIHWLLVVEAGLVVATLPTLAGFLLLERHPSNLLLYALLALPIGPAVQAALFTFRVGPRESEETPWRRYWRGYRAGWKQALVVWVPAPVIAAIALMNAAYADAAGIGDFFVVSGLVIASVLTVWSTAALAVVATFSFRTRDLSRVVMYGLGARPFSALGVLAIVFLAVALVAFTFDAVLVLVAALFAYGLLATARPMLEVIRSTFTPDTAQG